MAGSADGAEVGAGVATAVGDGGVTREGSSTGEEVGSTEGSASGDPVPATPTLMLGATLMSGATLECSQPRTGRPQREGMYVGSQTPFTSPPMGTEA
jgi:hypothetical protein